MLLDIYKKSDVRLTEAFGTEYPAYFLHPLVEYYALVNHAGIIDLTHWHLLTVSGSDRAAFLHAMLTNDIKVLAAGQGCHSCITTVKGKIIAELFVFARKDDHLVLVPSGDCDEVVTTLEKHIISEDVTITDVSGEFGILAVEGPKSEAVVKRLFLTGTVALPKDRFGIVSGAFESFDLTVINNTCTGDDGYHVVVPADEVARIREHLIQAARGSDGLPVGHTAWNIRRVENGIPWYGVDYTSDNFPPEVRLDHTVSYTKGCFRGQETLGRIHNRGDVKRLLVGLTVQTDAGNDLEKLAAEINTLTSRADENGLRARANTDAAMFDLSAAYPAGSKIFAAGDNTGGDAVTDTAEDKQKGQISSAVLSPHLRECLLLGYVRREALETETVIELQHGDKHENLSVIELPLATLKD